MSAEFNISPQSLETAAQGMQRCSEDLATAVEKLRTRVLDHGSPWGQSSGGSLFGEVYTECTGLGLQSLAHMAEVLGTVASGLNQMSQNLQAVDQANAGNFSKVL